MAVVEVEDELKRDAVELAPGALMSSARIVTGGDVSAARRCRKAASSSRTKRRNSSPRWSLGIAPAGLLCCTGRKDRSHRRWRPNGRNHRRRVARASRRPASPPRATCERSGDPSRRAEAAHAGRFRSRPRRRTSARERWRAIRKSSGGSSPRTLPICMDDKWRFCARRWHQRPRCLLHLFS